MKVLLVHNNENLDPLILLLKKSGMSVEYAINFKELFYNIENAHYDAVVINANHDEMHTLTMSFLEKMTNENRTEGMVIITGKDDLQKRLELFDKGADDVVQFDYSPFEIMARLRAIIKRKKYNSRNKLYFANMIIHFEERRVYVWNNPVSLTRKEYEILLHLIANKNRILTKESLAGYLWSDYADKSDTFDFLFTHLKNLRKKLINAKAEIIIKNYYGNGYQIEEY